MSSHIIQVDFMLLLLLLSVTKIIICLNRARWLIQHVNTIVKCICASHIVMRSYRETVSFVNVSPIDAFDVFESYEVFVLSIRACYALVLSILLLQAWIALYESETIWWVFAWPPLYSKYYNKWNPLILYHIIIITIRYAEFRRIWNKSWCRIS